MANEALVNCNIYIQKGKLEHRSLPTSFQADVATGKGPSPGAFAAVHTGNGTQVDLSNLSTPALATIQNFDSSNYVEFGVVISGTFYRLFEVQAGEIYPFRFSRSLSADGNSGIFYIRANTASCDVAVNGFEA